MGIKDLYYISEINYKTAMETVIKNHYLHRKAACSFAFGLFEKETDRLVGVITYGSPASPVVCRGVCGEDEAKNVIELTRLWIEDITPKNAESFLIGNTIKLVDKEIIITYAEKDVGHRGTIYQATNFIYLGLTAKRTNRVKIDGSNNHKHNRHAAYDKENTILVPRPRKYRYVYFNADKRRKKELIHKLKYDVKKYPKGENKNV